MKKTILVILSVFLLIACREETIPTVTVDILPAELIGAGKDTVFDIISYQYTKDTLVIDTFRIDTFFIDTVRLNANVYYAGNQPYGSSLLEYGFCINTVPVPVYQSIAYNTPAEEYGNFNYTTIVRSIDTLYVYAYAVNPFGSIHSATRTVSLPLLDAR